MEIKTNTIASVAAVFSDQSNKENVPPVCNNTNKGKKISIPHTSPSFKHKKKGSASATKRKPKRVPLADITNLFNINSDRSTLTLAQRQPQIGVSALLSDPAISQRRIVATSAIVPSSKTLRMGFR